MKKHISFSFTCVYLIFIEKYIGNAFIQKISKKNFEALKHLNEKWKIVFYSVLRKKN
jgi:hypothetical protein